MLIMPRVMNFEPGREKETNKVDGMCSIQPNQNFIFNTQKKNKKKKNKRKKERRKESTSILHDSTKINLQKQEQ